MQVETHEASEVADDEMDDGEKFLFASDAELSGASTEIEENEVQDLEQDSSDEEYVPERWDHGDVDDHIPIRRRTVGREEPEKEQSRNLRRIVRIRNIETEELKYDIESPKGTQTESLDKMMNFGRRMHEQETGNDQLRGSMGRKTELMKNYDRANPTSKQSLHETSQLSSVVTKLKKEKLGLESIICRRDEEIVRLKAAIDKQEEEKSHFKTTLKIRDDEIAQLRNSASTKWRKLKKLSGLQATIRKLEDKNARLEANRKKYRGEFASRSPMTNRENGKNQPRSRLKRLERERSNFESTIRERDHLIEHLHATIATCSKDLEHVVQGQETARQEAEVSWKEQYDIHCQKIQVLREENAQLRETANQGVDNAREKAQIREKMREEIESLQKEQSQQTRKLREENARNQETARQQIAALKEHNVKLQSTTSLQIQDLQQKMTQFSNMASQQLVALQHENTQLQNMPRQQMELHNNALDQLRDSARRLQTDNTQLQETIRQASEQTQAEMSRLTFKMQGLEMKLQEVNLLRAQCLVENQRLAGITDVQMKELKKVKEDKHQLMETVHNLEERAKEAESVRGRRQVREDGQLSAVAHQDDQYGAGDAAISRAELLEENETLRLIMSEQVDEVKRLQRLLGCAK